MLSELLRTVLGVIVRVVMVVGGLFFLASALVVALVLVSVWLLRAVGAKLTGQAVSPLTMQVNRPAAWSRFRKPAKQSRGQVGAQRRVESEVIDVEPKSIKTPHS